MRQNVRCDLMRERVSISFVRLVLFVFDIRTVPPAGAEVVVPGQEARFFLVRLVLKWSG